MTFYDVRHFNYERFVRFTKNNAPYKDSGNAYPLGERRYSSRHFRAEEDGSFTVWYADRETVDNKFGKKNDKAKRLDQHGNFYERQKLGIVRPDNTFEFLPDLSAGDNMLLCNVLGAYIHHDKARGGTIFEKTDRSAGMELIHPVFRGLRVNCDSGQTATPYQVFLPKVKRKVANQIMSRYSEFFSVFQTMIKAMDDRAISSVYIDLYEQNASKDKGAWRALNFTDVKRMIDEKRYVDAGCLFSMLSQQTHIRWRVEWHMNTYQERTVPDPPFIPLPSNWRSNVMNDLKSNFRKKILREHTEAFDFVEQRAGLELPASQWEVIVKADGKSVIRL